MAMNLSQQIFRDLEKFGNEYKDNPAACKQPGKRLSAWILACSCLDPPEKRKWQNTLFSYTQFLLFGDANKNGELDDFFLQCVENSSSFMTFAAKVLATFDKPQNVNQVQILALGDQYNKPDLEKAIQNIFSQDQPGSPDLRSLLLSEKQSWETFLFVHAEAGNAHVNSIVKDCLKEWVEGLLPRILQRPPLDGDLPPPPPPAAANIPFPAGMVAVACMAPGQFVTKIEDVMDLRLLEKAAQMPVDAGKAGGRKILYGKHFMFMLVGSAYWAGRKTAKIWTAASNYKIGIDKVIAISKSLQDETDVMLYVRWKGLCFCPDEPMKGNFSKGDPDKHSFSPHRVKGAGNHLGNLYNPLAKIVCPIQDQVGQTKYKAIQFEDEWIKMDVIQLLGRDAILHVRSFFMNDIPGLPQDPNSFVGTMRRCRKSIDKRKSFGFCIVISFNPNTNRYQVLFEDGHCESLTKQALDSADYAPAEPADIATNLNSTLQKFAGAFETAVADRDASDEYFSYWKEYLRIDL